MPLSTERLTGPKPTELFSIKEINQMVPELVALAWQNFLKRIAAGWDEAEAKAILIKDLERYKDIKTCPKNVPGLLLDRDCATERDNLVDYLSGTFQPTESRHFEKYLSSVNKDQLIDADQIIDNIVSEYREISITSDQLLNRLAEIIQDGPPKITLVQLRKRVHKYNLYLSKALEIYDRDKRLLEIRRQLEVMRELSVEIKRMARERGIITKDS